MIGVIIIGDEILSGRRQDKHLSKVIELLTQRGMALSWARYIGDDPERITQTVAEALAGPDVVISFGGIGATPDDHTRACSARAAGQRLVLHPQARELILARCRFLAEKEGIPFDPSSEENLRRLEMGVFPESAAIVPNPYNGIPGFSLQNQVHFLPGFPVMAWPMTEWLLDHLHSDLHQQAHLASRAVIVYGAFESRLTPLMVDIEKQFPAIKVFSLPSEDHPVHGYHIELGVKGAAHEVNEAFDALRQRLIEMGAQIGPEVVH